MARAALRPSVLLALSREPPNASTPTLASTAYLPLVYIHNHSSFTKKQQVYYLKNKKHFFGYFPGEETLNPKRNIPLSIIITLGIVSVCYIGISAVLTLMIPYFIIDFDTPMPSAFNYVHLGWVSHIVTIGALISIATWFVLATIIPLANATMFKC